MSFRILPITLAGIFALCLFFSERSTAEYASSTSSSSFLSGSSQPLPAIGASPVLDNALIKQFPEKIGVFERGKLNKYNHHLGVSIGYNTQGMIITIYLLDAEEKIEDGILAEPVINEFRRASNQLESFEERGLYQNLKKTSAGEKSFPTRPDSTMDYLVASYEYRFVSDEENKQIRRLSSGLLVTGYKNHVLKIRLTRRLDASIDEIETMDAFLRELHEKVL